MANKKKSKCGKILPLVVAVVYVISVLGTAMAHYANTASWQTVIKLKSSRLSSDCLVPGGQMVLLGEWDMAETEKEFVITFRADGATDQGTLVAEDTEYFSVDLSVEEFGLSGSGENTVTVFLELTDAAKKQRSEAETIDFTIKWISEAETLEGTFRVILLDAPMLLSERGEAVESQEIVESEENTETEETTVEEGITEEVESSVEEDSTDIEADDTTEAEESADIEEEPTTEVEESTTAEESTEVEDIPIEAPVVNAPELFGIEGRLPIQIYLPAGSTEVEFSLYNEDTAEKEVFPAFTRYTTDGKSWFMLYYGGTIYVSAEEADNRQMIIFEMPEAYLNENATVCVQTCVYINGEAGEYNRIASHAIITAVTMDEGLHFISGADSEIRIELPVEWSECCTLLQTVEVLTTNETGQTEYSFINITDYSLSMTMDAGMMIVRAGEMLPQAGTYRLTLAWYYGGVEFTRKEIIFFVNYVE